MKLAYEIWDVFTNKALSGNQLAVIPDATGLSDTQMQAIAKEFNLSETSFVLPSTVADIRARYFTPARELPMAGHPSIGTIYACFASGRVQKENASLELNIGVVPMTLELDTSGALQRVWMGQGVPNLIDLVTQRAAVAKALGLSETDLVADLPIQIVSAGNDFMIVPLKTLSALGQAQLTLSMLPPVLPENYRRVFVMTQDAPNSDVRTRMFGEAMGVREDPGTGSAHGPLGWYIAQHKLIELQGDTVQFVSHQGVEMGRPSELHVRATTTPQGTSVEVGGQAVKVAEGHLWL